MIKLGLSKYDYSLLLEKWEIKIVYPEETAKQIMAELERHAKNFFLEKEGEPKTVKIQFYELGTGCISWVETFCNFQFTPQYSVFYERNEILRLKVEAITDEGIHINITPQEV